MKKKYTTPKMEVKKCLVEDFIAATQQGSSITDGSGETYKGETKENVDQVSKKYNAWESWD